MNEKTRAIALLMFASIFSQPSFALDKLRSWPTTTPVISEDIKEQYEYDPAAGSGANGIYGFELTRSDGSSRKSMLADENLVTAYHGFDALLTMKIASTIELDYKESNPWPSDSIKIHKKTINTETGIKNIASKTCYKDRSVPAPVKISILEGDLIRYQCIERVAYGETGSYKETRSIYWYSTFFDTTIAQLPETGCLNFPPCEWQYSILYKDKSGSAKKIPFKSSDIESH